MPTFSPQKNDSPTTTIWCGETQNTFLVYCLLCYPIDLLRSGHPPTYQDFMLKFFAPFSHPNMHELAAQTHWLIILALGLNFCSFLPADTLHLFKVMRVQHYTEINTFQYIFYIFPNSFPRLLYSTVRTWQQKKTSSNCLGKLEVVSVKRLHSHKKSDVEFAISCWLDWSSFEQFLICNICGDYHFANLTLLSTGLSWFVSIHRPPRKSHWVPGRKQQHTAALYFS